MVRWLIWSQVGFAMIGLVGSLADQGAIPRTLTPPEPVFLIAVLSPFVCPFVVLWSGRRRKPGTGQFREVVFSVGLAATTLLCLYPMFQ